MQGWRKKLPSFNLNGNLFIETVITPNNTCAYGGFSKPLVNFHDYLRNHNKISYSNFSPHFFSRSTFFIH